MKKYFWNVLISLDQTLLNVVPSPLLNFILRPAYNFGNPDETASSVLGKNVELGSCNGCYYLCRLLSLFDARHCYKSIERDER